MDFDSSSWVIIIISLLFSAFFSGMEIAFLTANKLRIELENKQGLFSSKIVSNKFLKSPSRFISTLLVGNNISLVVYGILMASMLDPLIKQFVRGEVAVLAIQTIISTLIILVTAEFLPKALFRINPNKILSFFALPALILFYALYPLVFLTIGLSQFILGTLFKVKLSEGQLTFGRIDLDNYVKEFTVKGDQKVIEHEVQIFQNALDFSSVKVRESMIPRTEMVAVEVRTSISDLKQQFIETGLSKILIYKESIDNIIGYVHSYEMFKRPETIQAVLLPVLIVPETMPAQEAMGLFIQERKSIAVVVDEFGGTSGIITIEDVMEEIFGEIEDEHDTEDLEETKLSDSEFLFSGRLQVEYINNEYNLELPVSDEYGTLAGLIMKECGSFPEVNEQIGIGLFEFTVLEVSDTRIEKVRLTLASKI